MMEITSPHAQQPVVGWTDARVKRLKKLYAEGLSCSQIANELGHVSRNAIIGKCHRIGLERRGNGGNYNGNQRSKPGPKPRPRTVRPEPRFRPLSPRPRREAPELIALRCAEITPRGLTLLELKHGQCRYPYGGETPANPISFCGHPSVKDRSYCSAHLALSTAGMGGKMTRDRIFHYSTHDRIDDWLACGWMVMPANGVMHHHIYGVVVEWLCDCKMVRPT